MGSASQASSDDESRSSPAGEARDVFVSTQWSVVLTAARSDTTRAQEALAALCQTYWRPLYIYARGRGCSRENAEDLVQGFFAHFLQKNRLGGLNREQGRFRAFLLASLKHFMANEWDRAHRLKRGGHATHLSLDWPEAESRCQVEEAGALNPDRAYDREWALTLLDVVFGGLRDECIAEGKAESFHQLKGYLSVGKSEIPYAEVARRLNQDIGAVRVAVHRLRRRYRKLVRQEIARTLSSPEQVDEEMRSLFAALTA